MVSSRASRSRVDMGQTSSQPQLQSVEASAPKHQKKTKDKRGKSKKSKRKSAGMERPIDQEDEESALTLMQMSEAPIQHSRIPYFESNHSLSAQLTSESPPMHPSTEPVQRSKRRKMNDKRGPKKRGQTDTYECSDSEERSNGAEQYPDLPSTPPRQIDRSSPSPYRPKFFPVNALDDIPTDDDDVAAYEEYAKDAASADPSGLSDHDIFSFSQQPPNPFEQDEAVQSMHDTSQLPDSVYEIPQSAEKQKKRKRKRRTDAQEDFAHEQGQRLSHPDFEAFNDFLEIDTSPANLFYNYKGDNMPIDPELHGINALPPSADLSNLKDGDLNVLQKKRRGSGRHGSSQPRKRRRLGELQSANVTDLPYMSPYSFQHDQENVKDEVLPGLEDMQRQSSSGLGSPFPEKAVGRDYDSSDDVVQVKKSARRKKKGEGKPTKSEKEREDSRERSKIERAAEDKVENRGAFSAAEGLQLDAFRDNYCEANDMTIRQFNDLIQTPMRGNAQVTAIFNEIHDVLSYRPRMSVQKFCRRRFYNCLRGPFSAEEDEMLKQAVAEKGKAWKQIGNSLGRLPEDCRDRWRNYVDNAEYRNREQWTDAEVVNLCTAILDCMQLMKEDRMRARDEGEDMPECGTESDQEVEDMKHINWQTVSDRMGEHGGGRSRLQCIVKWGQLKKREQDDFLKAIRESRDIGKKKTRPVKNPWRTVLASKKVANMKPGDVRALLRAVLDTDVPEEGNIPWKSLGDDEFRATWNSNDKKTAWSRLKEKIEGSELMDYRSIANELLSWQTNEGADALKERWDPQLHGDVSALKNGKKRKYSRRKNKGTKKEEVDPTNHYLQKSNEFVSDSDDMDGDAEDQARLGAFAPQGYNRYNALPMSDDMDGGVNTRNWIESITTDDEEDGLNARRNANGHLPMADGEVSPEFAGRLQSALNAYT